MRLWKMVGLAVVVGAVTAGVTSLKKRRGWQEPDPDELREFLHQRMAYKKVARRDV